MFGKITVAAVAGIAIFFSAPVASADPIVRCSPAPCKIKPGSWEKAFSNAPWEKIWPGPKKSNEPAKKGPWEKAFENAPMP